MRLIKNIGTDRVLDHLTPRLASGANLDVATSKLSLFAFDALKARLGSVTRTRVLIATDAQPAFRHRRMPLNAPASAADPLLDGLLGDEHDRERRNALDTRGLAEDCLQWLNGGVEMRSVHAALPQAALIASMSDNRRKPAAGVAITGDCAFTTTGLGLAPGNPFSLIQCSETEAERRMLAQWFDATWQSVLAASDIDIPEKRACP